MFLSLEVKKDVKFYYINMNVLLHNVLIKNKDLNMLNKIF